MTADKSALDKFVAAARKVKRATEEGGFGHAIFCNWHSTTDNQPSCNCGINNTLTALRQYDQSNPKPNE